MSNIINKVLTIAVMLDTCMILDCLVRLIILLYLHSSLTQPRLNKSLCVLEIGENYKNTS